MIAKEGLYKMSITEEQFLKASEELINEDETIIEDIDLLFRKVASKLNCQFHEAANVGIMMAITDELSAHVKKQPKSKKKKIK